METPKIEVIREKRFWLFNGIRRIASAKPDVVFIDHERNRALLLDYKSLSFGHHDSSDTNLQLRSQAVALKESMPNLTSITTGLVQAGHKTELCEYDEASLALASKEWRVEIEAQKPDAPLNPGERQCKYCPCVLHCPAITKEFDSFALQPSLLG